MEQEDERDDLPWFGVRLVNERVPLFATARTMAAPTWTFVRVIEDEEEA